MLLTADLHLTHKVPSARRENDNEYLDHQRKILKFISNQTQKLKCDLCIAGDIFDKYNVSSDIIAMFVKFIADCYGKVYTIPGNHDEKFRSTDMIGTAYNVIQQVELVTGKVITTKDGRVFGIPYTDHLGDCDVSTEFLLVHTLCYENEKAAGMTPRDTYTTAQELLDMFPNAKYIVVGDQHNPFLFEQGSRYVINCGTVQKRSIDYKDKELVVWYADAGGVYSIPLPADDGIYDELHLELKAKSGKVTELVEAFGSINGTTVNFIKNIYDALLTDTALSCYAIAKIKIYVPPEV